MLSLVTVVRVELWIVVVIIEIDVRLIESLIFMLHTK